MSEPHNVPKPRIFDPMFVVMLVAVVLAIGSSLALRLAAGGLGPKSAKASEVAPTEPPVAVENQR